MPQLRGFFDASHQGSEVSDKWTAIGGYIGTEEAWSEVERKWAEGKALWQLQEFKLASINAGQAIGVGHTKAPLCIRWFANVLRKSDLIGICAAVKDEDWRVRYTGTTFPTPYHLCLSMLLEEIDWHVRSERNDSAVSVVLDDDQFQDTALAKLVEHWTQAGPSIASLEFARRDQYPSIECADLCAGAGRSFFASGGWTNSGSDENWRLWGLVANQRRGAFWSLEVDRLADQARRKIAHRDAAPSGQIPLA